MKNLFKNIAASILTLTIFILILNSAIGLIFEQEISRVKWVRDHKVKLRRSKNPRIMFEIVPDVGEANSQGLRDFNYTIKKPKNVYRIVVIGDSIAYGMGVEIKETFSKQLEKVLNDEKKDIAIKYEVINFSVPGYSTLQEAEVLRSKAIRYNPDLAIIAVFANDNLVYSSEMNKIFSRDTSPDDFDRESFLYNPHMTRFKRCILGSNLCAFIRYRLALIKDAKIYKSTNLKFLNFLEGRKSVRYVYDYYSDIDAVEEGFARIREVLDRYDLPCLVTYSPYTTHLIQRHFPHAHALFTTSFTVTGAKLKKICQAKPIHFLDITDVLFTEKIDDVFLDATHLTPYGHAIYAEEIYKKLKTIDKFRDY